jgi:tripartite-type tricarboxylate transporter receptor subunit TctC
MKAILAPVAVVGVVLAAATGFVQTATAQSDAAKSYPDHQVKIVVTVPAGGGVDAVTRIYAEKLRQKWKQNVVVENRGGAAGNLGAEIVAHSDPDGYTLMASQPAPITVNKFLYKTLKFDPDAMQPIFIMSEIPNVLLVRPDFPAKTAKEFFAYAKAHPGKLDYASQGIGTTSHLTAQLLEARTGLKFNHVPYRGTAPALNDLIGSHVDFIFMEMSSAAELNRAGKAHILAVATKERLKELPDVPTFGELGVKDFVSTTWNALTASPKTPKAIVDKINAAMTEIAKDPAMQKQFDHMHLQVEPLSTTQAKAFVDSETKEWGEVIKEAGIKAQ